MNSSLAGIVREFQLLKKSEQEFVLATIVETSGSTYRKAGASMLITRTGQFYGLLGGGCFEADLLEHAYKVFANKLSNTIYYDMRAPEDLVWGLGLGCNGAVRIRLEYLSIDNQFAPLSLIETALANGQRTVLITVCDSSHPAIAPDQHFSLTDTTDDALPQAIRESAALMSTTSPSSLQTFQIDGNTVQAFLSVVTPPLRLAVIGAGPDAVPVTQAAKLLGWEVSVIDYRESCTRPDNFPAADRTINSTPEQLAGMVNLQTIDAVVLMTHKFEYDLRYLQQLTTASIRYIGLLGPAARKNELLKSMDQTLYDAVKDRVYGPVGMNIGGELPEEIAYSLIAEIQAVMHDRHGGHLTDLVSAATSKTARLATIILAAGGSSRFGALKQLLEYNGSSLLKRAVIIATALPDNPVIVVHGPKATKCQREIAGYNVTNLVNKHWETGLSSSLKLAIDSVPPDRDAVLVLLCDQPLIRLEHLQQLIAAWTISPDKLIASQYAGTTGVPAIIPRSAFNDIHKLGGDSGAKKIIAGFAQNVVAIAIPEAEFDIDTEEDFAGLLARAEK